MHTWLSGYTTVEPEAARGFDPRVGGVGLARQITDWLRAPISVRVVITGGLSSARSTTSRSVLVTFDRARSASNVCLDAADVVPTSLSNAFNHATLEYLTDPGRLEALLTELDAVRTVTQQTRSRSSSASS